MIYFVTRPFYGLVSFYHTNELGIWVWFLVWVASESVVYFEKASLK